MTKARSGAARRRAKRAARERAAASGLPGLEPSKKREPNGRRQRAAVDRIPDAHRESIVARCRRAGLDPTPENLREMSAAWEGCTAGQWMARYAEDDEERHRLWSAIGHWRTVQAAYDRAIGAPPRHAKGARTEYLAEHMATDADTPPPDDRTDEEKVAAAKAAHRELEEWLMYADGMAYAEGKRVVIEDGPVRDWQGLMAALRCIADGLAGGPMVSRHRI